MAPRTECNRIPFITKRWILRGCWTCRIKYGWIKWKEISGLVNHCDNRILFWLQDKLYFLVRLTILQVKRWGRKIPEKSKATTLKPSCNFFIGRICISTAHVDHLELLVFLILPFNKDKKKVTIKYIIINDVTFNAASMNISSIIYFLEMSFGNYKLYRWTAV